MSQSSSINDNMGSPIEMGMTAEELEVARQEWQAELNQVDEEIQTLRQVIHLKIKVTFFLLILCIWDVSYQMEFCDRCSPPRPEELMN